MGVESHPVLGGRVSRGEREREGWKFRVKVLDSPAGRVSGELGASLPSKSLGARRALRVPGSVWLCHLAEEAVAEEVI